VIEPSNTFARRLTHCYIALAKICVCVTPPTQLKKDVKFNALMDLLRTPEVRTPLAETETSSTAVNG